ASAAVLVSLCLEDESEVLRRCVEQPYEGLCRGDELSQERSAGFVLAGQGGQLILDCLGVENLTVSETSFDGEILLLLDEVLDDASSRTGLLVAPSHPGHTLESCRGQLLDVRGVG